MNTALAIISISGTIIISFGIFCIKVPQTIEYLLANTFSEPGSEMFGETIDGHRYVKDGKPFGGRKIINDVTLGKLAKLQRFFIEVGIIIAVLPFVISWSFDASYIAQILAMFLLILSLPYYAYWRATYVSPATGRRILLHPTQFSPIKLITCGAAKFLFTWLHLAIAIFLYIAVAGTIFRILDFFV